MDQGSVAPPPIQPPSPTVVPDAVGTMEGPTAPTPIKSKNWLLTFLIILVILLSLGTAGFFAYQNVQLQQQVSRTTLTPPTSPTPTTNPATNLSEAEPKDWKTYTASLISFRYPPDWFVSPGDFLALLPEYRYKQIQNVPSQKESELYPREKYYPITIHRGLPIPPSENTKVISSKEITVNGVAATEYKIEYTKSLKDTYPVGYSWTITKIIYNGNDSEIALHNKQYRQIFDQILSTFTFTKPNIKTYVSQNLGISFSYKEKYDNGEIISTKELGNKIYVYSSVMKPEQGQYIEVFSKDPHDTLEAAITKMVLSGYSTSDCKITTGSKNLSGSSFFPLPGYVFATISIPNTTYVNDPSELEPELKKCPIHYVSYGGLAYFVADQNHPNKFVFFSIGQYAITGDTENNTWQDTLKFLN
jgi:hypothetical protein